MQHNTRSMQPVEIVEYLNQGIAALNYVQTHILTQENVNSIKDVFGSLESLGEQAKAVFLDAVAFVENTLQTNSRSLKTQSGLDNKLAKSRTLALYQAIAAELQPSLTAPKIQDKTTSKKDKADIKE